MNHAYCPAPDGGGVVSGLTDAVDCHVRTLVQDSYRDLVGPDTPFAAALTALLTIYIALVGYQLLLGRGHFTVAKTPLLALKLGLVLAFTTSWAAYQTVFFSLLFDGPNELARAVSRPLTQSSPWLGGDLDQNLDAAFQALRAAAEAYGAQAPAGANMLQGGPALASGLLWLAAIGMLIATAGVVIAAKIVLGFLLALGPVFVALFLFEHTRGFSDGWLRATVAFALAPLAATVFGTAMLMMLAPFIETLAISVSAGRLALTQAIAIATIVAVYAMIVLMAFRACATIASGFVRPGAAGAPGGDMRSARAAEAAAMRPLESASPSSRAPADSTSRTRELVKSVSAAAPLQQRLGHTHRRTPTPPSRPEKLK